MPQIDQIATTFGSQLFWLFLTFGLIYLVIGRSMLPKIQSTVDMRRKRIEDDLEAARVAHARADEIEEDYRRQQALDREAAHALTVEAKGKAARDTEAKLKKADAELAKKLAAAEAEIAAQRDAALAEIEDVATEAAQEIVAKLTSAKVTKAAASKAVKGALANG
ncbi:MAG: ATPase [Blastomonas sp.]